MDKVFIFLLNTSINASYLIIAVILLRFALFKAPKWISCLLWAAVGIRLAIPIKLESILSLLPSPEPIPQDIAISPSPQINTGIGVVNNTLNPIILDTFTPDPVQSANPLQIVFFIAAIIWITGLAAMLFWSAVSYLRLKRRVAPSIYAHDNVFYCDNIPAPFILGVFSPRIYLPSGISEEDAFHVIAHERAHIDRRDYIWKPLGFVILSVYWFNPLCWIAYILFCRDVEKACDERVIGKMQSDGRREYSSALLSCSVSRFGVSACPLAFGEIGVKSRIKSILNYKKPAFWIIIVSILLAIGLCIGFLTTPPKTPEIPSIIGNTDADTMTKKQKELFEIYPEYFGLDASNGLDVYVWQLAENNYNFGLKPHSDTPLGFISIELMSLKSANAYEMQEILKSYDIEREDVTIVPWQNPISSYIGDIWVIKEGEDAVAELEEYIANIEYMLFDREYLIADNLGYVPNTLGDPFYDTMTFDVDGDGVDEICSLGYGQTSGLFTFVFSANYPNGTVKYSTVINSQWLDLSFKLCEDGVVRVQGIDQQDTVHLYNIKISDGAVMLIGQDGQLLGDFVYYPIS